MLLQILNAFHLKVEKEMATHSSVLAWCWRRLLRVLWTAMVKDREAWHAAVQPATVLGTQTWGQSSRRPAFTMCLSRGGGSRETSGEAWFP